MPGPIDEGASNEELNSFFHTFTFSFFVLHSERILLLQRLRLEDEERRKREAQEKLRREKLEEEMRKKREAGKWTTRTLASSIFFIFFFHQNMKETKTSWILSLKIV